MAELLNFPCDFILKIVGKNTQEFVNEIKKTVQQYFPGTLDSDFSVRSSANQKYLAITASIYASDKAVLDMLYNNLSSNPHVIMVL